MLSAIEPPKPTLPPIAAAPAMDFISEISSANKVISPSLDFIFFIPFEFVMYDLVSLLISLLASEPASPTFPEALNAIDKASIVLSDSEDKLISPVTSIFDELI